MRASRSAVNCKLAQVLICPVMAIAANWCVSDRRTRITYRLEVSEGAHFCYSQHSPSSVRSYVLGMEHEHQNPFAGIKWHEQAVYDSTVVMRMYQHRTIVARSYCHSNAAEIAGLVQNLQWRLCLHQKQIQARLCSRPTHKMIKAVPVIRSSRTCRLGGIIDPRESSHRSRQSQGSNA